MVLAFGKKNEINQTVTAFQIANFHVSAGQFLNVLSPDQYISAARAKMVHG